ncbi:MAG: EamA family transporter [Coriobacteriia bacterium]|nr:EamA family transporter [Coriobacteriia bacterium]
MTPLLRPTPASGYARIVAAATVWGSIALLVRATGAHPAVIVFWRVLFAALAIGTYLGIKGRLHELPALSGRMKLRIAAMGVLLTLNWVLFLGALTLTKVAVAVLLGYLGPVFVAVLNPLVSRQPFDRRIVIPLVLALAGTTVIVGPQDLSLDDGRHLLGAGLALASSFTYALLIVFVKRLLKGIPASTYMLGEYLVAATVLLPAAVLLQGPIGGVEWAALATLGVVHTAFTGALFLTGLRLVPADRAAILTYAEPVSAVVLAALFLGERASMTTLVGGVGVVAAGIMVARLSPAETATVEGPPVSVTASDEPVETDTPEE